MSKTALCCLEILRNQWEVKQLEQIHTGTVAMKQFSAGAHVKGTRIDTNAKREEPIFDALMGQKKEQCSSDVVAEKSRKPEETREDAAPEQEAVEKSEKPVAGKEEEETCDVAREAAAAQIIWLVEPNAGHMEDLEQMRRVVAAGRPAVFAISNQPAKLVDGVLGEKLVELTREGLAVSEEIVAGVAPESEMQMEVNAGGEESAVMEFELDTVQEIEVEVEETGGEAVVAEAPLFDDVEAAPIKVAEAPARAEQSEPVEQQVTTKLADLLENGETKVQIQLEPVELGKLTIELTRSEDGTLSVLLDAEKAQTRGLLEKHMGTLQEALTERGQKVAQITVERGEEAQRHDNQQRDDFSDGRNGQPQQEQQRRDDRREGLDFLQQLRLGLIPLEDEEDK